MLYWRAMDDTPGGDGRAEFPSTEWGLLKLASRDTVAMDSVIRVYWKPLYFFARQKGYDGETAKDVVQDFLLKLLERKVVTRADPQRGRFRTLLLAALSNFIKDRKKERSREKRGGGQAVLSLDFAQGEREYALEAAGADPPDLLVDRAWARSLLAECVAELAGKEAHVEALKLHLGGADYATVARATGLTEAAARVAVHRLTPRLREVLVRHLRPTAVGKDELEAEIEEFIRLLR